jgi:hypothetical protein
MILALVCGSAALLALMSLATMIPLDIGVLPKGKYNRIHQNVLVFDQKIWFCLYPGYQRISSDTEDDVTPESNQSISVMA